MIIQRFSFIREPFELDLPDMFRSVRIAVEGGYSLRIWMMFDNTSAKYKKRFESFRDGAEIDPAYVYVGSYELGMVTYHLFLVRK